MYDPTHDARALGRALGKMPSTARRGGSLYKAAAQKARNAILGMVARGELYQEALAAWDQAMNGSSPPADVSEMLALATAIHAQYQVVEGVPPGGHSGGPAPGGGSPGGGLPSGGAPSLPGLPGMQQAGFGALGPVAVVLGVGLAAGLLLNAMKRNG